MIPHSFLKDTSKNYPKNKVFQNRGIIITDKKIDVVHHLSWIAEEKFVFVYRILMRTKH